MAHRRQRTMTTLALVDALVGVFMVLRADAHGMHGMHGAASTSGYKCPVCRMSTSDMGYDNNNFVTMVNGQRVFTCGMDPRQFEDYSFQSTDTAYLGANMAEFIVAPSDTDNYKCTDACEECASGLRDPIDGLDVTTDNFKFVCLSNGQKIYFASEETRTQYLEQVNQKPRAAVQIMTCSGNQCNDANQIQELSAAAKKFDPSTIKDADTPTTTTTPTADTPTTTTKTPTASDTHDHTNTAGGDDADASSGFCSGEGSVMFNGFQSTIHGSCVLLFFQPWKLNTAFKYVLGFFGCMLLALGNEYLAKFREQLRQKLLVARRGRPQDKAHRLSCKALLAFMYMIQMTVAYFAMLVVMTYETGLFIALILGFGAGFVLFKDFDQDVTNERGVWRYTDPSVVRIKVDGMSCMKNCGTTVENALTNTEGVTRAFVDFEEKCAYVAGGASIATLIEAIETVGFSAQVDQSNAAFTPANVECDVKKTV